MGTAAKTMESILPSRSKQISFIFDNKTVLGILMIAPAVIWDDRMLFRRLDEFLQSRGVLNAHVYTSVGELDDEQKIIQPWREYFAILEDANLQGLRLAKEIIAGETHISVYPAGFTRGLRYVFSGA